MPRRFDRIRLLKVAVFLVGLAPFLWLVWAIFNDALSADPVDNIRDFTGDWTMRFLMATLVISPLRQFTGWNAAIRLRRMLGLFAFFYVFLHFVTYLWLDKMFDFDAMLKDVQKRPYITAGFVGFVLFLPLAVTSTRKWISRLGGKRWQLLHRAIYLIAIASVIHYFGMVKLDTTYPWRYTWLTAGLLSVRLWQSFRRRRTGEVRSPVLTNKQLNMKSSAK